MIIIRLIIILFVCVPAIQSGAQIITTIAGSGTLFGGGYGAFSGDGGLATDAQFFSPISVVVDNSGNIYIADEFNYRIRKINTHDTITTIAGTGIYGYGGDDSIATLAKFCDLSYIKIASDGNLYVPDVCNNRIRKINLATDIISTYAGDGTTFCNDNDMATSASINYPFGVTFDNFNNFYLSDACDFVDKINLAGIMSRVAGSDSVDGYGGDGGQATNARFNHPVDIAFDNENNLYIVDAGNAEIRKVNTSGIITNYAGTPGVFGYFGDNGLATLAQLNYPEGIAIDGANNVFFSDCSNMVVRRIDNSTNIITTIAGNGIGGFSGDGGMATNAKLLSPAGLSFDTMGNLYIADWNNNRIRKVTNAGVPLKQSEVGRAESGVKIYPNPAKNFINISSSQIINRISISNIFGQCVYELYLNDDKAVVDVGDLPKGVYFVRLNGLMTRKFMKE